MTSQWQKPSFSNLSSFVHDSPLFIRYNFHQTGYDVHLTDLVHVWSESMDRRDVIRRALNDNTVIDPSEDRSQFQMLLAKVADGIAGQPDTDLQIYIPPSSTGLTLRVTTRLPAPLKPLEWTINLQQTDGNDIRTMVVGPVLQDCERLRSRVDGLRESVQAKDKIIHRLLDKVESAGMDLASIFPGLSRVSGLKIPQQRDWLSKNITGIAPYSSPSDDVLPSFCLDDKIKESIGESLSLSMATKSSFSWWELLPSRVDPVEFPSAGDEPTKGDDGGTLSNDQLLSSHTSSTGGQSGRDDFQDPFVDNQELPTVSSSPLRAPESQIFPHSRVPSFPPLDEPELSLPETHRPAHKAGPTTRKPGGLSGENTNTRRVKDEPSNTVDALSQPNQPTDTPPSADSISKSPKKKRIGLVRAAKVPLTTDTPDHPNLSRVSTDGSAFQSVKPEPESMDSSDTGSKSFDPHTDQPTSVPAPDTADVKADLMRQELRRAYNLKEATMKQKKRRF